MKIIVSKLALEQAVVLLQKVINTKNALPILGDIMCMVNDKKLTMIASDSEVTMTTELTLEDHEGDGTFCVDGKKLKEALSQLAEQPLTILAKTESDMTMTIEHSSGETYFPIESADEFPLQPENKYTETLEDMDGLQIRDALKRSLWATPNNDTLRPTMNGVNFALNDGWLDIATTDGHVLVLSKYNVIDKVKANRCGSFIMPKKVANIVMANAGSESVDIEWNATCGHVKMWNCDIIFRLIDGKYPNYRSIIPEDQTMRARVQSGALMNSLKNVIPFTSDSSCMIRLDFWPSSEMTISGDDNDFGMGACNKIFIDEFTAEPFSIGLKGSTLLNIIQKMDGTEVYLNMKDPSRAITIEPAKHIEGQEILMLQMPMILNN